MSVTNGINMDYKIDMTQNNESKMEALKLTLQQLMNVQNNSEAFESEKKQFYEKFSQLFGSLTPQKPLKKIDVNMANIATNIAASTPTNNALFLNNASCSTSNTPTSSKVNSVSNLNILPSINGLNLVSPQLNQVSVPMSIISNNSYQYPYITSTPNQILSSTPTLTSNAVNSNVTAIETFWMRRILSNILLLFFRYHPNGVLEMELSQFYRQMFNEELIVTEDLKYLLCVHKSILITCTRERGRLYTLNDSQIGSFLQEFDRQTLQQWIIKHIRRLFRCFPNGIACNCLEDVLFNMCEFKISSIIPKWHDFILENIQNLYCLNIDGLDIYICVELDELNKKYKELSPNMNRHNITCNNVSHYLSKYLNRTCLLRRPVGYSELLIVLLSNTNSMAVDGETLEKMFYSLYKSRCVYEAPFIQDVLNKICQISTNAKDQKLYKLDDSSKQYFDTQPTAFAPILHRNLELHNNTASENNENSQECDNDILQSPFKEDHVSVFMGGFSHGTSVEDLRCELAKKGCRMISTSGISYRNYGWSFVTLSNAKEAQYLVSISPLVIHGRNIDVRPFINRQRVKNHISNKPSNEAMLSAIIDLLQQSTSQSKQGQSNIGLTVADIQSKLFRKFSYRIDGPDITKLVAENAKFLWLKRQGTERIFATPKMHKNVSFDELVSKVHNLWIHIQGNYRGNKYAETMNMAQTQSQTTANNANKTRSKRRKKAAKEHDFVISVNDFENEFGRRYRLQIDAKIFGFESVLKLMHSLKANGKISFCVIENVQNEKDENVIFDKESLKLEIESNQNNDSANDSNVTSPQFYINSPSNYSNRSFSAYKVQNGQNTNLSNVSSNSSNCSFASNASNVSSINNNTNNVVQQPYVLNSVGNYSVIPSVPNATTTTTMTLLNAINMNMNINVHSNK